MRVCSCLFLILILLHVGCTTMRCFIFTIQGLMYGESYESVFIFFNFIAGRMCHDEVFSLPSKDSFLMNQCIGMYS